MAVAEDRSVWAGVIFLSAATPGKLSRLAQRPLRDIKQCLRLNFFTNCHLLSAKPPSPVIFISSAQLMHKVRTVPPTHHLFHTAHQVLRDTQ